MTPLAKLEQKRAATVARIEKLEQDEQRVAAKLAAAKQLVSTLDEQIAAATAAPATPVAPAE